MVDLVCAPSTRAQQPSAKEEKRVRKIKKEIAGLERWDDPVTVKLQDGTKVKGQIGEVADDHFVLSDSRHHTRVDYSQVKDVSVGFGTRTKIAGAIAGGVLAIIAVCLI